MNPKENLEYYLKKYFNHEAFRDRQKEAIESVLRGRDTLVMLPTGTGKSICYQLTGYLKDGITVIVSPLLSLMEDQAGKMRERGEKRVASLNSLLSRHEKEIILQSLEEIKFLFLSPEMLYQPQVLNRIKQQKIALFAVDEAHCISQWGFDFRPEYLNLGEIKKELGSPVTMALTATATEKVQAEILNILKFDKENYSSVISSVDRPNIYLKVEQTNGNRDELLVSYAEKLMKPGIIYFSSKKTAERCAELLHQKKLGRVAVYHSEISSEDKMKIQAQFTADEIDLVCATSAFGMGIDKPDIRFVLHYHMPGSPEQYLQELGRCGRDGLPSVAVILSDPRDRMIQLSLLEKSYPTKEMLQAAYKGNFKKIENQMTDTQETLAQYYVQSKLSFSEAAHIIEQRKMIKINQIEWLQKFVRSTSCLREQLMDYFQETLLEKPEKCCSNETEDKMDYFYEEKNVPSTKRKQRITFEEESSVENWTKVIENLFRISN